MLDYQKLKSLREETGVSFSLCKKALEETNNDIEKAKKKLTEWGAEKAAEKATRQTTQGGLFTYVHHNRKVAATIELLCETDFVGSNPEFFNLGQEIAMQLASMRANNADELLKQEYVRDPARKVGDLLKDAILKFGENIKIGKINRFELGR